MVWYGGTIPPPTVPPGGASNVNHWLRAWYISTIPNSMVKWVSYSASIIRISSDTISEEAIHVRFVSSQYGMVPILYMISNHRFRRITRFRIHRRLRIDLEPPCKRLRRQWHHPINQPQPWPNNSESSQSPWPRKGPTQRQG